MNLHRIRLVLLLCTLALLTLFTACGGGTSSPTTPPPQTPTLSSIALTASSTGNMNANDTRQYTATGTYSDASTKDLTSTGTWSSSNTSVATVSAGVVTAKAGGSATITVSTSGKTASATVTVNATVTGITVSPSSATVTVAGTQQLSAVANYTDGSSQDVTSSTTWTTSASSTATVSAGGLVTGVAGGSVTITGTYNGMTSTASIVVKTSGVSVVSLALSPVNSTVSVGSTLQLSATATYSDASTADVSSQATWSSSDATLATVNSAGLVSGVAIGGVTVTATLDGVSGTTAVQVRPALLSVVISPASPTLNISSTQQLSALGEFSDGSEQDMTAQATWSSATASVATVDNTGMATALTAGSSVITATVNGVSGTTTLTVSPATLTGIVVDQDGDAINIGDSEQLTATGTYSDGSAAPLVGVTFSSSDTTVLNIDSNGVAIPVSAGSVTVTATLGGVSGTGTITVNPATLLSIALSPASATLPLGLSQQFTVNGTFSDSTTQPLSAGITWSSSDTTVATVDSNGLVTPVAVGTTTITATDGALSSSATVTVTNAVLVSIAVSPASATMPATITQQFTATGTYSDGTTQDLTHTATWVSSNGSVASISLSGLALGITPGSVTITASSGSVSGTANLTIDTATIVSLAITPADQTVSQGTNVKYTATATFSDGTSVAVTSGVAWKSTKPSVAHINGAGLAKAHKKGVTTIKATFDGQTATTSLTVQ